MKLVRTLRTAFNFIKRHYPMAEERDAERFVSTFIFLCKIRCVEPSHYKSLTSLRLF